MLGRLRSLYVHAWHVPDYGEYRSLSNTHFKYVYRLVHGDS